LRILNDELYTLVLENSRTPNVQGFLWSWEIHVVALFYYVT